MLLRQTAARRCPTNETCSSVHLSLSSYVIHISHSFFLRSREGGRWRWRKICVEENSLVLCSEIVYCHQLGWAGLDGTRNGVKDRDWMEDWCGVVWCLGTGMGMGHMAWQSQRPASQTAVVFLFIFYFASCGRSVVLCYFEILKRLELLFCAIKFLTFFRNIFLNFIHY